MQAAIEKVCLDAGKRGALAFGDSQPSASIPFGSRGRRFFVARAGQRRDLGLETAGNLANVG